MEFTDIKRDKEFLLACKIVHKLLLDAVFPQAARFVVVIQLSYVEEARHNKVLRHVNTII